MRVGLRQLCYLPYTYLPYLFCWWVATIVGSWHRLVQSKKHSISYHPSGLSKLSKYLIPDLTGKDLLSMIDYWQWQLARTVAYELFMMDD